MRADVVVLAAVLGSGCGGPETVDPGECTVDTWDNWAQGFLRTWCTSCHSSQLAGDFRYGAPDGVDFDTYDGLYPYRALIAAVAGGSEPSMPPVGGPGDADRARLVDWVACGAPGEGGPWVADVCDGSIAEHAGGAHVTSAQDAAGLCADEPLRIVGDLRVSAGASVDCVCEVTGHLEITGGDAVALGALRQVGGDLRIVGAPTLQQVGLGHLEQVGGAVAIEDLARMDAVLLPRLRTVGGDLRVARLDVADRVDLTRLTTVEGSLVIEDLPQFRALVGDAGDLVHIGGDLVLADLDQWLGFYGFDWLVSVGGTVRILDHDRISQIRGFNLLTELDGLVVQGNSNLRAVGGFGSLPSLTGDLRVAGNRMLERLDTLDSLQSVDGAVQVVDNASLSVIGGLIKATELGGLRIERNGLTGLAPWALMDVVGDVVIDGNAELVSVQAFGALTTVGGSFRIQGSPDLTAVADLAALSTLGADLVFDDLGGLTALPAAPSLATVGGGLTVRGVGVGALSGLEAMRSVGALTLQGNPQLVDVSAMAGLTEVTGNVVISGNGALAPSAATALVEGIPRIDGTVTVENNGAG